MALVEYKSAKDSYRHWFDTRHLMGINEARERDTIVLIAGDGVHTIAVESAAMVAKAVMEAELMEVERKP